MLKKSIQKQYLEQHWENLETQFNNFCEEQDPEALHQFRVETKKIHSLLKLQASKDGGRICLKEFLPVREIFKLAGRIREAQLHVANLDALGIRESKIKSKLLQKIDFQSMKFGLKKRWYSQVLEGGREKIKDSLVSFEGDLAESFLHQQVRFVSKNCHRVYYLGTLHDTRKAIKTLQHIRELFPEFQMNWDYLEVIQRKIGEWHDLHRSYLYIYHKGASAQSCTLIRNAQQEKVTEIKDLIRKFDIEIKQMAPVAQD